MDACAPLAAERRHQQPTAGSSYPKNLYRANQKGAIELKEKNQSKNGWNSQLCSQRCYLVRRCFYRTKGYLSWRKG